MATRVQRELPYQKSQVIPSPDELKRIRDRLGFHVAEAMRQIAQISEEGQQNADDLKSLQKGYWYPVDLARALKKKNTPNAIKRYEYLRNKGYLRRGRMPAQYFTLISQNGEQRCFEWLMRSDQKPSQVLQAAKKGFDNIKDGFAILDCGAAVILARHIGLLHYLEEVNGPVGVQKFDRYFTQPDGAWMNIGWTDDELQPMRYLIKYTPAVYAISIGTIGHRPVQVGQYASINGVPDYQIKHPHGQESNYNVICVDDTPGKQLFTGHGITPKGSSEMEIYAQLVKEYNEDPDYYIRIPKSEMGMTASALTTFHCIEKKDHKLSLAHPEKVVQGYDPSSHQDFEPRLIYDIVQAPLEKISLSFIQQNPYASNDYAMTAPDLTAQSIIELFKQFQLSNKKV